MTNVIDDILDDAAERIEELEQENARLREILAKFKPWGTDDCAACFSGRVTLFHTTSKCMSCAPEDYAVAKESK